MGVAFCLFIAIISKSFWELIHRVFVRWVTIRLNPNVAYNNTRM